MGYHIFLLIIGSVNDCAMEQEKLDESEESDDELDLKEPLEDEINDTTNRMGETRNMKKMEKRNKVIVLLINWKP